MAVGYHAPTAAAAHETARSAQLDVLRTRQQVLTESEPEHRSSMRSAPPTRSASLYSSSSPIRALPHRTETRLEIVDSGRRTM